MRRNLISIVAAGAALFLATNGVSSAQSSAPDPWRGDLAPIAAKDWKAEQAAHLLARAGFGGTPEQIAKLAAMNPSEAVRSLVYFDKADNSHLKPFDHSGIHDPGLEPFPESRPAATERAKETGESMGVRSKPAGNRPLQPATNKFFYWLRASALETGRVGYWWANRMLTSNAPLQEKLALFWHGHFANNEDKVRDYRKLLNQLELFQAKGAGSFRDLTVAVAQDPAMLTFLDAGKNVKGAPNENFAREIMELFTMGVGNYGEKDVREAARAFTGWNYVDTKFVVNADQHDAGPKTFLGRTGNFDGVQVIDIIMEQPVTANFLAGKLYRFFVREDLDPKLQGKLGDILRKNKYEIAPFLEAVFLSKDFYSQSSIGAQIQGPVEMAISTYKKLGLNYVPGVPDFNAATGALGQRLFAPPTVAGWAQGRSWITPGLLLERGNFAREFIPAPVATQFGNGRLSSGSAAGQGFGDVEQLRQQRAGVIGNLRAQRLPKIVGHVGLPCPPQHFGQCEGAQRQAGFGRDAWIVPGEPEQLPRGFGRWQGGSGGSQANELGVGSRRLVRACAEELAHEPFHFPGVSVGGFDAAQSQPCAALFVG